MRKKTSNLIPSKGSPILVGMTGGIASGKSTVASILKQNGIPVIDADELSHALTGPGGKAISQILSAFGPGVLDHPESRELASLNRTQMRGLIFKNPLLRKKLEAKSNGS